MENGKFGDACGAQMHKMRLFNSVEQFKLEYYAAWKYSVNSFGFESNKKWIDDFRQSKNLIVNDLCYYISFI